MSIEKQRLRVRPARVVLLAFLALIPVLLWGAAPGAAHPVSFHGDASGGPVTWSWHPFVDGLTPLARLTTASVVPCNETTGRAGPYPCKNVDLAAYLPTDVIGGGGTGSDIWGWTDPVTKKEWAIVNHAQGTAFVDVTIPEAPLMWAGLPTILPGAVWRESKVYNNHVYIVQDLIGPGMQIFDLKHLRSPVPLGVVTEDALYTGQGLANVHTITINEATGFAYLDGSNTCSGGPHMLDLKPDPLAPVFVGCFASDGYTHDAQCVVYHGPDTAHQGKEICALYNEDTLTIVDVTSKSAPVLLSRTGYPGASYTHQGWFTEDQRYILLDDELDEGTTANSTIKTTTYLWNMTDLDAPQLIAPFKHQTICVDHNQYVVGNLVYQSNYACGLRIQRLDGIAGGTLTEVAYFDTMPATDISFNIGGDLTGDWSNYPYFRSGTVVVSNITEGLFVLQPRPLTPTAVNVMGFRARPTGRNVELTWRTGAEVRTLGFNVWRYAGGKGVKVNRALVPAKAVGRAGGAAYRLLDRNAKPGVSTYRIQVVSTDGRRAWRASAVPRGR